LGGSESLGHKMPFVKVVVNNFSRGYSGVRCEGPGKRFGGLEGAKSPDSDRRVWFIFGLKNLEKN
jgi:hypothetical protein